MRIHLPLEPKHFTSNPTGPLAKIGGELVLIELQGRIEVEGDTANSVIGVLGLDRPDHPTLHIGQHHLLHGKMATLPRPYAVIRRAVADSGANIEGDAADEESDAEREAEQEALLSSPVAPKKPRLPATAANDAEEDEPPLFPEIVTPTRPTRDLPPSSPPAPSSQGPEYSSDLSSPMQGMDAWGFSRRTGSDDEHEEDEDARQEREEERRERERKRRRANRPPRERARHYEVVAVVRKKIVFGLRPEPLVAATEMPE